MTSFNITTPASVYGQPQFLLQGPHLSERILPNDHDSGYESEFDFLRPPIYDLLRPQDHMSRLLERVQPDDYDSGYESDEDTVRPSSTDPLPFHEDIYGHVNPALSLRQRPSHDIPPSTHIEPFSSPGKTFEHDSSTPKTSGQAESSAHISAQPTLKPLANPTQSDACSSFPFPSLTSSPSASASSSSSSSSPSESPQPSPSPYPTQSQLHVPSVRLGRCDMATQTPADWWREGEITVARDGRGRGEGGWGNERIAACM